LLLGSAEDPLIGEVGRLLSAEGRHTYVLSEDRLFEDTSFACEHGADACVGFLEIDGEKLALDRIGAVLVRTPRNWWPGADLEIRDQMFVFHETLAAWIAVLSCLACPVVNRFPIGWWLGDATFPESLGLALCDKIGLAPTMVQPPMDRGMRLLPTPRDQAQGAASVYVIGDRVIAADTAATPLAERLASMREDLVAWQNDTGVSFCRIDCVEEAGTHLRYVEAFPLLDPEPANIRQRIGRGVAGLLT
jgi:hypothetical protein